jgi:glycosyltransferase involved in cell wall biosynthesis/GT2 family glycosyltransferase
VRAPLDICLVTSDLVGPIRNGGIGTAYSALARHLARAGHRVTVLYALGRYCEQGTIEDWQMLYARDGITLALLPDTDAGGPVPLRVAVNVYRWLTDRRFDIVHYHEWRGIGAYAAQAKRQGLGLTDTVLVAGVHSPSLWHREGMREPPTADDLEVDFLERQSVALADELWSPSRHMLAWLRREGWQLPRRVMVRPYVVLDRSAASPVDAPPKAELVFFGRLETRKGLDVFCDALDLLTRAGRAPSRVTFLGKAAQVEGQPSLEFIRTRAEAWPSQVRIETGWDRDQALAYLREPGRVAVMPSRLDNLPFTVLECLAAQVPFLAARTGGIPELIRKADHTRVLFDLTPASLARLVSASLEAGLAGARPAQGFDEVAAGWLAWHGQIAARPIPPRPRPRQPLVSVCMTTRNRPHFLIEALGSICRQDYPRLEVVLVDDGSDTPEAEATLAALEPAFAARGWTLIRQNNRYLGAARNRAVDAARGEFVLFMDDDNLAEPHEIRTFVGAATTSGAEILTCFLRTFQSADAQPAADTPTTTWPFLGAAVGPGIRRNVFGDANALIRRSVFTRLGGFTEDVGVGCEDWEFFARAVLSGVRLEVVPEALVRYRQSPTGMLHTTSKPANHLRAIRPYLAHGSAAWRGLVHLAAQHGAPAAVPDAAMLDTVRTAVVFGSGEAGKKALGLARTCGWEVGWIVDNNPSMWNQTVHDLPVKSPASLRAGGFDLVIVASLAGKATIAKQLGDLGLTSGQHFVHFLDPVRVGGLTHQVTLA